MKEINLYLRGSCSIKDNYKLGQYIVVLEYKGVERSLYSKVINESLTANRMMIQGFIDAVKVLKEPCKINLYTHGPMGLKYMLTNKGNKRKGVRNCVNKDLLIILKKELNKGKHEVIENIGRYRQDELIDRLKEYNLSYEVGNK